MSFSDDEVDRYARQLVLREIGASPEFALRMLADWARRRRCTWRRRGSEPCG